MKQSAIVIGMLCLLLEVKVEAMDDSCLHNDSFISNSGKESASPEKKRPALYDKSFCPTSPKRAKFTASPYSSPSKKTAYDAEGLSPSEQLVTYTMNFQEGDLLYGLQREAREKYLTLIIKNLQKGQDVLCTADRYHSKIFLGDDMTQENIEMKLQKLESEKEETNNQKIVHYGRGILSELKDKYKEKEFSDTQWLKRFCKSAIDYTVKNGHKVHFLLKDLDQNQVVSRQKKFTQASSYTSCELRYIFRNWDKIKHSVIFYENDEITSAPWEAGIYKDLWAQYKIAKDKGEPVEEIEQVEQVKTRNRPQKHFPRTVRALNF